MACSSCSAALLVGGVSHPRRYRHLSAWLEAIATSQRKNQPENRLGLSFPSPGLIRKMVSHILRLFFETNFFLSHKPAYQNLRQKVDNFVSTHLDKQEWNPTMNKNQLRNGLRQSVIQSGMLEAGVDRIISQVVDPKLNHIFRPQIERAIHEFLAAQKKEESVPAPPPEPENKDPPAPSQDAS
ncbi:PREDICTED: biorientation of chromosomes in cell division protein 1-like [Phaethon lepturus]|uniref:biorientation of chromosomes in cell division protein 1-like n=1 Tax=Phaethon lepturus TaxID=97097 RepID=UPI000530AD14|nr:PREDICTED: biorientation of chromosomes in cell division protein 1-like [Phaethon lepturus]